MSVAGFPLLEQRDLRFWSLPPSHWQRPKAPDEPLREEGLTPDSWTMFPMIAAMPVAFRPFSRR